MTAPLAALAVQIGAPIVRAALERRLGGDGRLADAVTGAIARRLGAEPETLDTLAETDPGRVIDAMREVERDAPDMIALHAAEIEAAAALAQAMQADPAWMRAWRPGWMYLLGFLWLWNLVLLHVCNALWKIALPPLPTTDLLALTGMFLALYMGGHTVLRLMGKAGSA